MDGEGSKTVEVGEFSPTSQIFDLSLTHKPVRSFTGGEDLQAVTCMVNRIQFKDYEAR